RRSALIRVATLAIEQHAHFQAGPLSQAGLLGAGNYKRLPAALAGLLNQRASGGIDDARQVGQARSGLGFDNRADIGLAGVHAGGVSDQIGEDAFVLAERWPGVHPRAFAGAADHLLYLPVGPGTNNLLVADDLVHL